MKNLLIAFAGTCVLAVAASGAVVYSTSHGNAAMAGLEQPIAVGDLLSGLIPVEQPGDLFWHPVNTAAEDRLPAFTDDHGPNGRIFYGLLNDPFFGGEGSDDPVKLVQYDLGGPKNIAELRIYSGNINNADGRVFSTTVVLYSTDGGGFFHELGYFQSDPSGTTNYGVHNSTLVRIFDDQGQALLAGVTHLQFNFYAVHRNNDQMHDPYNGANPYTSADDGLLSPFTSPLIWEIDALAFTGEVCNNGVDDDGDSFVDCADPGCFQSPLCPCNRPFADSDGDEDVDQSDFAAFQLCFTGLELGVPVIPGVLCDCFERTGDGRINEDDLARFTLCVSGPAIPADKTCGD
ncbi:MAG: hypothetical protein AMXMBFR83_04360 [Phycisphaerae bacterium]